jgi:hypothetical protein
MINSNDIQDAVIRSLDMDKLGGILADRILADADFYTMLQEKLIYNLVSNFSHIPSSFESRIVEKMSEQFLREKSQEILAKVDVGAVLNAIALRSAKGLGERL